MKLNMSKLHKRQKSANRSQKMGRNVSVDPTVRQGSQLDPISSIPDAVAPPPPPPPSPPDPATFASPLAVQPAEPSPTADSDLARIAPVPAAAPENLSSEILSSLQAAIEESRDDYLRLTTTLDQLSEQQTHHDAKLADLETRLNNLRNQ